jgi:hypothetical protein
VLSIKHRIAANLNGLIYRIYSSKIEWSNISK